MTTNAQCNVTNLFACEGPQERNRKSLDHLHPHYPLCTNTPQSHSSHYNWLRITQTVTVSSGKNFNSLDNYYNWLIYMKDLVCIKTNCNDRYKPWAFASFSVCRQQTNLLDASWISLDLGIRQFSLSWLDAILWVSHITICSGQTD